MQVESTVAIQALQPRVKEIQEKYKGRDPQEAQVWLLCHAEEVLEVLNMCHMTLCQNILQRLCLMGEQKIELRSLAWLTLLQVIPEAVCMCRWRSPSCIRW